MLLKQRPQYDGVVVAGVVQPMLPRQEGRLQCLTCTDELHYGLNPIRAAPEIARSGGPVVLHCIRVVRADLIGTGELLEACIRSRDVDCVLPHRH